MSLFLEDVNDPEPTVYDRRESAEAHLDRCWSVLEDEVECREDIARVKKLVRDVEAAIAELDELIDACDMADEAGTRRMWSAKEIDRDEFV